MNLRVIARNVGFALLVSALFMFISVIVSILNGMDSALTALMISFSLTFITGIFPFIFVRKTNTISLKDGYMIIFLSWLLSFIFGMLPYALWGGPFDIVNAWFESVSGFTTTGASILEDVEALPKSLIFWRSSTHFIGGLGVVVFLLLIIPNSSPVRLRLTQMELSSLSRDGYDSRANKTVTIFASVYLGLCALAFFSYWAAGMSPFDAINHAFSVCAAGGFSSRTQSIGAFNSVLIDVITIVFMFLASIHFGLIFMMLVRRSLKPFRNKVLQTYTAALCAVSIVTALSLRFGDANLGWGDAFLQGTFHIVSYASTTGFAIGDNSTWPHLACFLMLAVSVVCGCAGSPTGGIKTDRLMVLFKAVLRQSKRILYPSTVAEIRVGNAVLKDEEVYPQILYIAMYFMIIGVSIVLCMILGDPNSHAVTGSVSCLGNVGPSIGSIGSMGNYNAEPDALKVIFSLDMFMGRVEIYPIFAVISMILNPKRK